MPSKSKTWKCPYCNLTQTCIGVIEGHHCPNKQSKWVPGSKWTEVVKVTTDSTVPQP